MEGTNEPAPDDWIVWGSVLSPFTLKVLLACRHAGRRVRLLPATGTPRENWSAMIRRERLVRGYLPLTWPRMTEDDEFPLVPFLFGPDGENLYDSTAIAEWLDRDLAPERQLVPADPALRFVARLVDDYADEFGLYVAHHNRWKVSARDNDAGQRVAEEFRFAWGPMRTVLSGWFPARQVRRLPYLFSVAPEGFSIEGLPARRQPPSRPGFPPTHGLLERAFSRLCGVLEMLLRQRPFVLGDGFTLADLGLYGSLGMNLSDPTANQEVCDRAPTLHGWLRELHSGVSPLASEGTELRLGEEIRPLLREIWQTHVPLMRQNLAACEDWKRKGETLFNEAAFDRERALYDGELDGHPFRAVAKTFQAKVWRERVAEWRALPEASRAVLEPLLPPDHGLDAD